MEYRTSSGDTYFTSDANVSYDSSPQVNYESRPSSGKCPGGCRICTKRCV